MKRKIFISVLLIGLIIGFNSCKLGSDSNYSPRITIMNPALINTDSTLRMGYTVEGNIKFDSLHVNDTITVGVIGEGFTNSLKKFNYVISDTAAVKMIMPDSIKKFFDPTSDFIAGKLVYTPNIVWMNLPFKFVAKLPKEKVKINFILESDAVDVSNQAAIQLEFPIKP